MQGPENGMITLSEGQQAFPVKSQPATLPGLIGYVPCSGHAMPPL